MKWPLPGGGELCYVIECKAVGPKRGFKSAMTEAVGQVAMYMDRSGAESGHAVLFDLRPGRPWKERIFRRDPQPGALPVTVWGL